MADLNSIVDSNATLCAAMEALKVSSPSPNRMCSSSPSPPPSASRLWRPAAQRNLRNQWSKFTALKQQWATASFNGKSHATALVNAYLSQKYMPSMELGALSDMPEIRKKASSKLFKQQVLHQSKLLSSYKELVTIVAQMVNTSRSMRCFLKATGNSSLVEFSRYSTDVDDVGDGGGIPVFMYWSISSFEKLADELVQMFRLEVTLKRLLVMQFLSITWEVPQPDKFCWSDELYQGEFDDLSACSIYISETSDVVLLKDSDSDMPVPQHNFQPSEETVQEHLTTWLAEVNIDMLRLDEILAVTEEEIHITL